MGADEEVRRVFGGAERSNGARSIDIGAKASTSLRRIQTGVHDATGTLPTISQVVDAALQELERRLTAGGVKVPTVCDRVLTAKALAALARRASGATARRGER